MSPPFNEIEWLNAYFGDPEQKFERHNIESVLYFALMWNMFESLACEKFARVSVIELKVNSLYCKGVLKVEDFAPYLDYFRNRYVSKGHLNGHFDNLKFRRNEKKELVGSVLLGDLDDINNLVLALLLIVYRLRNNLFHGEKNVYRLKYQVDNFKIANRLLATFLDVLKERN